MKTTRRNFPLEVVAEIVQRATIDGRVSCECCGIWLKSRQDYEIDHTIAEGVRPSWRKRRKLTAADGQLLCKSLCHPAKTLNDKALIAEAKRRAARDLNAWRGLGGQTEIARRYACDD